MPESPPPTPWDFALDRAQSGEDLVGLGADLEVATLHAAYSVGVFPMGVGEHGAPPIGWWSPDPRGVLRLGDLRVSRSLRKAAKHFEIRVDTAFDDVVAGCADPDREGRWITTEVTDAYAELHAAGWAHSIETWQDDRLVGGLYGVAIGGLFAGESMFHTARDASKVALVGLHELLSDGHPDRLIDVQWRTDHLATLGVTEVPRETYRELLGRALRVPLPRPWR
ncbi:MAG: leucyl/phenylalanyl-tRNA--protein transferase [Terracoccus sp.]